jgi:hypothetical protein
MRYRAPHCSCCECWADADRAGNHPRCCQRNVPALRVGKSVPGLFQNARVHLSAVRKGRSASRVVSLGDAAAGRGLQKTAMATTRPCGLLPDGDDSGVDSAQRVWSWAGLRTRNQALSLLCWSLPEVRWIISFMIHTCLRHQFRRSVMARGIPTGAQNLAGAPC